MGRTSVLKKNHFGLNVKQLRAADMIANGASIKEVAIILFDCVDEANGMTDERKLRSAVRKIREWTKLPGFQEEYRELVRQAILPDFARAYRVLGKQLEDKNAWLQNKAANDILTRFGPQVMGEDSNQITVKIEGMPTMGAPDMMESIADGREVYGEGEVQ